MTPDLIQEQAQAYLQPARNLVTFAGGEADAQAAKDSIIKIIAAQVKISPDDAAKRFNDAQAKLQQAKDKAVQTAKNAADASASAASTTSIAAFGVLLLGGIAAAVGGTRAVQRRLREGELVRRSALTL